ncbi:uncharacterized protein EI90DRAFT_3075100 [Cantharellus anzutake]|uniref:uncharacterized protein n=1 Tax=Cantharellus anzutake TaxID=1750568 RepID=UPI001904DDF1|nr:uncharacterized protein EI90DRAFT_3075100 [Cantharellus anzutake]KAF8324569.1 hypothetical protein EI90DRAFT_3075100 [Cantharellus anzutake]
MGVGRNEALRIAEAVRNAGPRGLDAWLAAKAYDAWIRPDWEDIKVDKMEEVLYLKFTQHRELREELISTYPAQLMWGTKRDAFFGIGPDGDGRNELGKLLMSVRERLKDEGGYDISDSS